MRAVIYARYSSDLQSENSIADQVRLCRAEAERQNWSVIEVYSDRAISGGGVAESTLPSPQRQPCTAPS